MATSTTVSTAGLFADGATVGAYPVSNWPNGTVNQSAAPVGSATATGTVSNGSVSITGLTTNTRYALAVSGGTRYTFVDTSDYTPGVQQTSADIADSTVTGTDVQDASLTIADIDQPSVGTWFFNHTLGPAGVTATANYIWVCGVTVPWKATLTGINYYVAGTSNGNVRSALYNAAGTRVVERTTNSAQASANTTHAVAFDAPYVASPGFYFMSLIFSSSTATFYGGQSTSGPGVFTLQGGFTHPASITPPTAPAIVPIMSTY